MKQIAFFFSSGSPEDHECRAETGPKQKSRSHSRPHDGPRQLHLLRLHKPEKAQELMNIAFVVFHCSKKNIN